MFRIVFLVADPCFIDPGEEGIHLGLIVLNCNCLRVQSWRGDSHKLKANLRHIWPIDFFHTVRQLRFDCMPKSLGFEGCIPSFRPPHIQEKSRKQRQIRICWHVLNLKSATTDPPLSTTSINGQRIYTPFTNYNWKMNKKDTCLLLAGHETRSATISRRLLLIAAVTSNVRWWILHQRPTKLRHVPSSQLDTKQQGSQTRTGLPDSHI